MTDPVIRFERVWKSFPLYHHLQGGLKGFLFRFPRSLMRLRQEGFVALRDVSFRVPRGQTLGLIGRNGAGKSTVLGLTAGVIRPSRGEISVSEIPFPLLELGAGFHPDFTAAENIVLNGMLLGMPKRLVKSRVDPIIEFAEIGEFADQPVRTFSSGMVARLGFSVVAHLDPSLLLIDEVLAVGDARFQSKCREALERFRHQGCTILLVSHDLDEVQRLCDRVLWIEEGRVRNEGPPREVARAYFEEAGPEPPAELGVA